MVYFKNQNSNFGILLKALECNISVILWACFMNIWYLIAIWLFNGLLVYFVVSLYIVVCLVQFSNYGFMYQEYLATQSETYFVF
jgi:hypothetical protein